MARPTNVFKIDRRDVQEQYALAAVLKNEEHSKAIRVFCRLFSIILDEDAIRARTKDLNTLRSLILAEDKKTSKK